MAHLPKETVEVIKDFLRTRHNIPHSVAVWALDKEYDIKVSPNAIINIRKRFELPYMQDKKVHNAVQFARGKGMEINHDYLLRRCPQICREHRMFLVAQHARNERRELPPFKVGGIAGVVAQIMLAA